MENSNEEIIALLEKATAFYNEAQDAYDFQAYAHASSMREQAAGLLLQAFKAAPVLQQHFRDIWQLLNFPNQIFSDFQEYQLEIARKLLDRDHISNKDNWNE